VLVWGLWATGGLAASGGAKPPASHRKTLTCDVAYLPSRASWVRQVTVTYDLQRLRSVAVDGVGVHSFAVADTTILTSQDNERIQLDVDRLTWQSDFRGVATGQGRCALEE